MNRLSIRPRVGGPARAVLWVLLTAALLVGLGHAAMASHNHADVCPVCAWCHGWLVVFLTCALLLAVGASAVCAVRLQHPLPARFLSPGRSPPHA